MKKKIILYSGSLLLCMFTAMSLKAQVNTETAFYWENPYYINPASVNLDYKAYLSLAGRKQWMSMPGSPSTLFATGTLFLENYRTQTGIKVIRDKIGYVNTINLELSYAYVLKVAWNSYVNMGISGAFQTQSLDRDKAIVEDETDPIFGSGKYSRKKKGNASIGVEYVFDKMLTVGLASQNLFSFLQKEPNIWGGVNYLYARYRTRRLGKSYDNGVYRTASIARSYDLEAGACVKQYKDDIQVDGMVTLYLNQSLREGVFQFSLFGRSVGEIGVSAGMKVAGDFKILGAYDYNFKGINRNSHGTFEVLLSYPIKKNNNCRSGWDKITL